MLRANVSRNSYLQSILLVVLGVASASCLDRPVIEASPRTTSRFLTQQEQNRVDKIDLLFAIDDSRSMSDKQQVLSQAVPDLLQRLVNPDCVRDDGTAVGPSEDGQCPAGTTLDFDPVKDIHIGVITSSLGGHGADTCTGEKENLKAHLVRASNADFLSWSGGNNDAYAGLSSSFRSMVIGPGQEGCGYEAQIESVYRFLIDPDPYEKIQVVVEERSGNQYSIAKLEGTDQSILDQRKAFLRPDSLVAVIVLTDENENSNIDGNQGFLPLRPKEHLPRGTSACLRDPNDPCCFSCGVEPSKSGCLSPKDDPECRKGKYSNEEDNANVRNTMQKLRYGNDYLYPVRRWVDGFTKTTIKDRAGNDVSNPMFMDLQCKDDSSCKPPRSPNLVYVAGIVGVPWQDIARDPDDLKKGFQTAKELKERGTWDLILGDPNSRPPVPPKDPLMVESIMPRTSLPAAPQGQAPAGPDSAVWAHRKNGHEWNTDKAYVPNSDLQYACIFRLDTPQTYKQDDTASECYHSQETHNPLCQNPDTGEYGDTQYFAKAYPGLRELEFLEELGEQAIVASICPATTDEAKKMDKDYGYRPAVDALVDRLRLNLRGQCLPRRLEIDQVEDSPTFGQAPCLVLEAFDSADGKCNCDDSKEYPGRMTPDPGTIDAKTRETYSCICEVNQLTGAERNECRTVAGESSNQPDGWCYVDPRQGGSCDIVKDCPADRLRLIRFVGKAKPRPGARVIIECQESPTVDQQETPCR